MKARCDKACILATGDSFMAALAAQLQRMLRQQLRMAARLGLPQPLLHGLRRLVHVHAVDDAQPQHLLPAPAYLIVWMAALTGIVFVPTHLLLKKLCPPAAKAV